MAESLYNNKKQKYVMKKRLILASAAIAVLAAAVCLILSFISNDYFILRNYNTEKIQFIYPSKEGMEFSVSYMHSVNKSYVEEFYQIRDQDIYLISMRYKTFGVGMPTEINFNAGETLRYEDGFMIIEGFDRYMPYINYNVGRVANHTLHLEEKEIPLNKVDTPGEALSFEVVKCSYLEYLLYKVRLRI